MQKFKSEFDMGEEVYLKTDPEQLKHIITGVAFYIDGGSSYLIAAGSKSFWCNAFELTDHKTY